MRFNIKKDFETVYLRARGYLKGFTTKDKSLLTLPETQKVIRYLVYKHYKSREKFWNSIGMDDSDIHSIVSMYSLYYISKLNEKEIDYRHLMNFVGQRITYCIKCFKRKEKLEERVNTNDLCVEEVDIQNLLSASYENIDFELKGAKKDLSSNKTKDLTESNAVRKATVSRLQLKLNKDPYKYKKELVYYAISKHVGLDVRKKARKYCKKYGIDYIEVAKKIFLGKGKDNHFDL